MYFLENTQIFSTVIYGRMHLMCAFPHFMDEETVVERLNNLLKMVQLISDKANTQNLALAVSTVPF